MFLLEFPCFFYDPVYVGNLISGSSAFSKSSLYIWNFLVHILFKLNLKDLSNFHFISHASKVMLKILQARLQQYVNQEFPDVQAGFRKGRGTRNQITNIFWIVGKENSRKMSTFASLTTLNPLTVNHTKLWKILKEMGTQDHLTCFLRNLYAGHEVTESDLEQWTGSKLGKEYIKAVYCHPAYLTSMQSTQWHPTPVLLPGDSHGQRSLVGCSPWGCFRVGHD